MTSQGNPNDLELIREVNDHFTPFYPYIAQFVDELAPANAETLLDIGPYSGGNSFALLPLRPQLRITLGDGDDAVNDYLRSWNEANGTGRTIAVDRLDKYALGRPDESVDVVLFRGGLFFWDDQPQILREAYRVTRPGGVALVGGGFGADAPNELVEANLPRSRELNIALGKDRLSSREVQQFVNEAGVSDVTELDHRHGLWAVMRKPAS